jgi:hypothetical protein
MYDNLHLAIGVQGEWLEYLSANERMEDLFQQRYDLLAQEGVSDVQSEKAKALEQQLADAHVELQKELGDICYYVTMLTVIHGLDLSHVSLAPDSEQIPTYDTFEALGTEIKRKYIYQQEGTDVLYYAVEMAWYTVLSICSIHNWRIEDILQQNYEKLAKRYPNLVFTTQDSQERKDEA